MARIVHVVSARLFDVIFLARLTRTYTCDVMDTML